MRRFATETLLLQYNTIMKGLPYRLSQCYYSDSGTKKTDLHNTKYAKRGNRLTPQQHNTSRFLDPPIRSADSHPRGKDAILQAMEAAKTLNQLLESIPHNTQLMDEQHLKTASMKLDNLLRNASNVTIETLHHHKGFTQLCQRICELAPSIDHPRPLINYLKTMTLCRIGPETEIVKILLQEIARSAYNLGIQQIFFLDYLLGKFKGPAVNEIQRIMPFAFEHVIKSQMSLDNVKTMCKCLSYGLKVLSPPETIEYIVDGLSRSCQTWTPEDTCTIIMLIAETRAMESYDLVALAKLAVDRLQDVVDQCDEGRLHRTIFAIGQKYAATRRYWYNENLFKAVAKRAVREKWGFESSYSVARAFSKTGFVSIEFLDHLSTLMKTKELSVDEASHLIIAFSTANYKPPNFQDLVERLLTVNVKSLHRESVPLLKLVWGMAILEVYPHSLIELVFQESFLRRFHSSSATHLELMKLAFIYLSVSTMCPDYSGPLPDPTLIEKAKSEAKAFLRTVMSPYPLEIPLERALGGPSYVMSGVFTKYGHLIDHVLVFQPDYHPVAIEADPSNSTSIRNVEDVNVPPGSKMLLIFVLRPEYFAINVKRLRGIRAAELRSLESVGYNVMTIDLEEWESLPEQERIPFVMQEIRKKNLFADR